jgi:hypothetical protein
VNPYDKQQQAAAPAQAVNPYEQQQQQQPAAAKTEAASRAAPLPPPAAPEAADHATVRAKALYAFESTDESELGLVEGEEILLFSAEDNDGWFEAEKGGRTGLVPASYVEILR